MEFLIIFTLFFLVESNSHHCENNYQWDPEFKVCQPCRSNQVYNQTTRSCMSISEANTLCKKGFQFDKLEKRCMDIDECITDISPCQKYEYCRNLEGSYLCDDGEYCGQGYKYNKVLEKCEDIDECKLNIHSCQSDEICENIFGSFNCRPTCPKDKPYFWKSSCQPCIEGFRLNRTTKQCEDVDECVGPYKLRCEPFKEICVKKPVLSKCVTHCSGGTTTLDGQCNDIDECSTNIHNCTKNQLCSNYFGYFTCTDVFCNDNQFYNNVAKECQCKNGLKWSINSQNCEDINECIENEQICSIYGKCSNTFGNYECKCDEGYQSMNGTCLDINECKSIPGICGHLKCENIAGRYNCVCPPGYLKDKQQNMCHDINECTETPDICYSNFGYQKQLCYNLIGTYKCIQSECPSEYQLMKRSDNINECRLINTQCSFTNNEGCINMMPGKLLYQVVQIKNTDPIPYKIGMVDLADLDFDSYYTKINVRKSINTKTKRNIDITNAIILKRSKDDKRVFIHIVKPLPYFTELIIDVYVNINHNSSDQIYSLIQFHVFVDDVNL